MSTITKAHKGQVYDYVIADEPSTFTVESVFRNPAVGFAGNRLAPFASGVWSDGRRGFVNLHTLEEGDDYALIQPST